MNYERLELETRQILRDPTVETLLGNWLNDVVLELAAEYELPALRLRTPAVITTNTTDWLYALSAAVHSTVTWVYLKKVFRVSSTEVQQGFLLETDFTSIDDIDPTHADTGTEVQRVVVDADTLGIYPKAVDSLSVWFYRKPVAMAAPLDEPDGIPEPYHYRVLIPMVVLRAFRLYPELITDISPRGDNTRALLLWERKLREGLWGDGAQIGMIDYLSKAARLATPQVRGPRLGQNVGGGVTNRRWW